MWSVQKMRELKIDHTNVICPHSAEPEALDSAVGLQKQTHIFNAFPIFRFFKLIPCDLQLRPVIIISFELWILSMKKFLFTFL